MHRARVIHPIQFEARVSYRPEFRFAEMTLLGILTTLIQSYRVEPHPRFAGESFEQLKERYSQATGVLTLT